MFKKLSRVFRKGSEKESKSPSKSKAGSATSTTTSEFFAGPAAASTEGSEALREVSAQQKERGELGSVDLGDNDSSAGLETSSSHPSSLSCSTNSNSSSSSGLQYEDQKHDNQVVNNNSTPVEDKHTLYSKEQGIESGSNALAIQDEGLLQKEEEIDDVRTEKNSGGDIESCSESTCHTSSTESTVVTTRPVSTDDDDDLCFMTPPSTPAKVELKKDSHQNQVINISSENICPSTKEPPEQTEFTPVSSGIGSGLEVVGSSGGHTGSPPLTTKTAEAEEQVTVNMGNAQKKEGSGGGGSAGSSPKSRTYHKTHSGVLSPPSEGSTRENGHNGGISMDVKGNTDNNANLAIVGKTIEDTDDDEDEEEVYSIGDMDEVLLSPEEEGFTDATLDSTLIAPDTSSMSLVQEVLSAVSQAGLMTDDHLTSLGPPDATNNTKSETDSTPGLESHNANLDHSEIGMAKNELGNMTEGNNSDAPPTTNDNETTPGASDASDSQAENGGIDVENSSTLVTVNAESPSGDFGEEKIAIVCDQPELLCKNTAVEGLKDGTEDSVENGVNSGVSDGVELGVKGALEDASVLSGVGCTDNGDGPQTQAPTQTPAIIRGERPEQPPSNVLESRDENEISPPEQTHGAGRIADSSRAAADLNRVNEQKITPEHLPEAQVGVLLPKLPAGHSKQRPTTPTSEMNSTETNNQSNTGTELSTSGLNTSEIPLGENAAVKCTEVIVINQSCDEGGTNADFSQAESVATVTDFGGVENAVVAMLPDADSGIPLGGGAELENGGLSERETVARKPERSAGSPERNGDLLSKISSKTESPNESTLSEEKHSFEEEEKDSKSQVADIHNNTADSSCNDLQTKENDNTTSLDTVSVPKSGDILVKDITENGTGSDSSNSSPAKDVSSVDTVIRDTVEGQVIEENTPVLPSQVNEQPSHLVITDTTTTTTAAPLCQELALPQHSPHRDADTSCMEDTDLPVSNDNHDLPVSNEVPKTDNNKDTNQVKKEEAVEVSAGGQGVHSDDDDVGGTHPETVSANLLDAENNSPCRGAPKQEVSSGLDAGMDTAHPTDVRLGMKDEEGGLLNEGVVGTPGSEIPSLIRICERSLSTGGLVGEEEGERYHSKHSNEGGAGRDSNNQENGVSVHPTLNTASEEGVKRGGDREGETHADSVVPGGAPTGEISDKDNCNMVDRPQPRDGPSVKDTDPEMPGESHTVAVPAAPPSGENTVLNPDNTAADLDTGSIGTGGGGGQGPEATAQNINDRDRHGSHDDNKAGSNKTKPAPELDTRDSDAVAEKLIATERENHKDKTEDLPVDSNDDVQLDDDGYTLVAHVKEKGVDDQNKVETSLGESSITDNSTKETGDQSSQGSTDTPPPLPVSLPPSMDTENISTPDLTTPACGTVATKSEDSENSDEFFDCPVEGVSEENVREKRVPSEDGTPGEKSQTTTETNELTTQMGQIVSDTDEVHAVVIGSKSDAAVVDMGHCGSVCVDSTKDDTDRLYGAKEDTGESSGAENNTADHEDVKNNTDNNQDGVTVNHDHNGAVVTVGSDGAKGDTSNQGDTKSGIVTKADNVSDEIGDTGGVPGAGAHKDVHQHNVQVPDALGGVESAAEQEMSDRSPRLVAAVRRKHHDSHTSEEDFPSDPILQLLTLTAEQAESRLAAKRLARAEARDIRMKELEKQQKDAEEKQDRHFELMSDHRSIEERMLKSKKPSTKWMHMGLMDSVKELLKKDSHYSTSRMIGSSSYSGSRRGSDDSSDADRETSREMKKEFSGMQDKYKKAMMTNASLDNEKQTLRHTVDTLKDQSEELEEQNIELVRENKDRCRDLENRKREIKDLQYQVRVLKEQIQQRDELIQEHGLVLVGGEVNGDLKDNEKVPKAALVTPESAQLLEKAGEGTLDERLRMFAQEKQDLLAEIKKLKQQLDEERERSALAEKYSSPRPSTLNGPDMQLLDLQKGRHSRDPSWSRGRNSRDTSRGRFSRDPSSERESSMQRTLNEVDKVKHGAELERFKRDAQRQLSDYKFKLQKAETDITTLEGNVIRLESQVKRYKTSSDTYEKMEDDLKSEKRKLQRELRESQAAMEELQVQNNHLQKRLDKMRTTRNAILNS